MSWRWQRLLIEIEGFQMIPPSMQLAADDRELANTARMSLLSYCRRILNQPNLMILPTGMQTNYDPDSSRGPEGVK